MRNAVDLLTHYAAFHRDRRNIASHFVGVPMIVLAVGVLLARPKLPLAGLDWTPAWVGFVPVALWYLTRGQFVLGAVTSAATALLLIAGERIAGGSTLAWLAWGLSLLALGGLIQLVGHLYEGRKRALVDDFLALLVGPLFVTAEALFALGWNRQLLAQIESRVGPTMLRDLARIA